MKSKLKWKFLKLNGVINRKYKVSNRGQIVTSSDMEPLPQHNMLKKSPLNGSDYKAVHISGEGKTRVHRIVCETFHGNAPLGKNFVGHLDDYKDNNDASNLKWVSVSENAKAYYENNAVIRHSLAKISQVKKLINKGWTNDRIAQKTKMGDSNVSAIKLGLIHVNVLPYSHYQ